MSLFPYAFARPLLFNMDPEKAHELTLEGIARLQHSPLTCLYGESRVDDPVTLAGMHLANRVGLAAGLDKNARCIDGLAAMGFGFVEVGTVTPKAPGGQSQTAHVPPAGQTGPDQPAGLQQRRPGCFSEKRPESPVSGLSRWSTPMRLGLNIGKNAATPIERATDDYLICLEGVYPHADYVTVNISSPNTQNLRSLQSDEALDALVGAVAERRELLAQRTGKRIPVFIKIAPDLDTAQIDVIAATLRRYGCDSEGKPNQAFGVIATNTTLSREAVTGLPHASEAGGLSGAPVLESSNRVIARLREQLGTGFPIIGVGGILSGADAVSKIRAGADVVQIYTGLDLQGPCAGARSRAGHQTHG